jgi:hypothetical protein
MDKQKYTLFLSEWLKSFLCKKYLDCEVEIIIPKSNISKITDDSIKKLKDYSLMDFSPDIIGIIKSNKNEEMKFVLLNRSISPISVKEIGEMNLYSKIIKPELAFIVSLKGLPNEVNSLLLNSSIEESLLNYSDSKSIIIFRLNEKGLIDKKTIFPRKFKDFF